MDGRIPPADARRKHSLRREIGKRTLEPGIFMRRNQKAPGPVAQLALVIRIAIGGNRLAPACGGDRARDRQRVVPGRVLLDAPEIAPLDAAGEEPAAQHEGDR